MLNCLGAADIFGIVARNTKNGKDKSTNIAQSVARVGSTNQKSEEGGGDG